MKKAFRKTLSVLMTAVIIFTCWVWVMPVNAQSGGYDVKLELDLAEHKRAWTLYWGSMKIYPDSNEHTNVYVWCIGKDGTARKQTLNIFDGTDNSVYTLLFSDVSYPDTIKIEYAFIDIYGEDIGITGNICFYGKLAEIKVNASISEAGNNSYVNAGEIVYNKNNVTLSSGNNFEFVALGICFINTDGYIVSGSQKFPGGKKTPAGYDFDEDSYSFENYSSMIPYGYFKTMYNDGKAWALYKKKWYQGGVCFGMTYTTASLYNGLPSGHTIRNLSDNSKLSIGNYGLTLETFIDYAHIYQFSREFSRGTVWTNGITIYNLVKEYLEADNIGVTIGMTRKDNTGGHRVLAVGIDGNDILIDDPNNADDYERLTVKSDGRWSFSGLNGWNSDTCKIRYNLDYFGPYKFISTMKTLNVNDSFIDNTTIDKIAQNSSSEYLSGDSVLLSINSDEYVLENSNSTKVELEYNNKSISNDSPELYWIDKNETITISDVNDEDSEIEVAGNENVLALKLDKSSEINITLNEDENIIRTNLTIAENSDCEIQNTSFDDNSNPLTLTISGTTSSDTVTATQTETGLLVTGISDGVVTLTKDEEVIATEEIKDAIGDVEIMYDKEGESEELDADYHTHSYETEETKAATCKETGILTYTCSCNDSYTEAIATNPDNHIGETEVRNIKESTCTEKGYTGDTYCLDCGKKIASGEKTDIKGHTASDWITDNTPTCSVEGSKHIECTVCEEVLKTEPIAKLPHDYTSVVTAPTCEKDGYTTYICNCGEIYTDDEIPATGHNYSEGVCEICGESKVDNCSCNCHKTGFSGFIWKILRFFYKLFGMNKTCSCGVAHY